jgi:hypothetical protein
MTDPRKFLVEHPIAQRLADLAGIEHDLTIVMRTCDLFLGSPSVGSEEAVVRSNAIGAFAIITYFRTLANGVRGGVTAAQLEILPQSLKESHAQLKNVRDHYLAHSINRQEINVVEICFKEDGKSIDSLGTNHSRPATFSNSEIASLKSLAESVQQIISAEYSQELDKVWDFIEGLSEGERSAVLREHKTAGIYWDWHQKRRKLGA